MVMEKDLFTVKLLPEFKVMKLTWLRKSHIWHGVRIIVDVLMLRLALKLLSYLLLHTLLYVECRVESEWLLS